MKRILFVLITLLYSICFGQVQPRQEYFDLIKKAEIYYNTKEYKNSAFAYSRAFKSNGWKASTTDRYNAACCWALANYPDSAFYNLNRLATLGKYINYGHISTDPDLNTLHKDNRWQALVAIIKANKDTAEAKLNKLLVKELDSILSDDQKYRMQIEQIEKKFGHDSKELKAHWEIIKQKDDVNLIKVKAILDKYGWLGPEVVGEEGNSTLFLVIQHSDQNTQEKYLPMMREAVKNKKAQASSLALLEDRVAIGQGKKQIYGSQISGYYGKYKFAPIEDEINVNKRRAAVGLEPIEDYARNFGIVYKQPDPNAIDNTNHFWEENSITISLMITVLLFFVVLFLLYRTNSFVWFCLLIAYFLLNFISITIDSYGNYSMIKHYQGNFILFTTSQALTYCAAIFLVNFSIYKLFKFKHILVEIASIFLAVIMYSFILVKPCQLLFLKDIGLAFYFNIAEPIIYSAAFLILTGIMFLISKRKRKLESNPDDSFTDK